MKCRLVRDWRKTEEAKEGLTMMHEGALYAAQSRLAALGHLDPHLPDKLLASPTVSRSFSGITTYSHLSLFARIFGLHRFLYESSFKRR